MAQLIELPNGDWCDPTQVRGIILGTLPDGRWTAQPATDQTVFVVLFPDEAAARAWAADFGRRVNEGRAE